MGALAADTPFLLSGIEDGMGVVLQLVGDVGSVCGCEVDFDGSAEAEGGPGAGEEGLAVGGLQCQMSEQLVKRHRDLSVGKLGRLLGWVKGSLRMFEVAI
jgi:hypothetical protein